jgi:hypothetical protein
VEFSTPSGPVQTVDRKSCGRKEMARLKATEWARRTLAGRTLTFYALSRDFFLVHSFVSVKQ